MRRFLLFISFCFMLLMPLSATEVTVVEDFSTENIWNLPTEPQKPTATETGSFTSKTTGYTYNASWGNGCYWYTNTNPDYTALLLGKTIDNFIEFPAFEGTVTKVEILNSANCTTKVSVKITDNNGDEIVAAQQFDTKNHTYTYDIPADKQVEGQVLRLVLNNAFNVQISKITITIEQSEPTGLSFTPNKITINGDEVPEFTFNNTNGVTVTWESSDTKVATVDPEGKVTVTGAGTTVITATGSDGDSAALTLNVNPIAGNISFFATTFVVIKDKDKDAEFVAPVLTNPNDLTVTYKSEPEGVVNPNTGKVTLGSSVTGNKATITATAAAQGIYAESTASYTIEVKEAGAPETKSQTLTADNFAATGTAYTDGTYSQDGITYTYNTAKNSSGSIQLRSKNSNSGIVVTANNNGYVLRKVTVVWDKSTTDGCQLDIYGNSNPYTETSELYATTGNTNQGTPLGSIVKGKDTEVTIDGDYQFIGLRSNSGAMYITSITLEWEAPAVPEFSSTLTLGNETVNDVKANTLTLAKVGDDLGSYNVYLNSTEIGAANNECNYLPYSTNGNFTISDGVTAYALTTNQFSYDFTQQEGEVTGVNYIALREDKYLVPGKTDEWYLSAEYTIAPKESALKGMVVTLSDFEITYEGHGEFSAFNGNKVTVAKVGTFKFVTNKVDDKDVTTAVYTIDKECLFGVNLNFPFFVYGSLQDMMQKSLGDPTVKTIKSTKQTVVYVGEVAQPGDEGGKISGVESVVVDSEGAVEYYNLQGVRVEGALTPGIYIRRSGNTATKISIR